MNTIKKYLNNMNLKHDSVVDANLKETEKVLLIGSEMTYIDKKVPAVLKQDFLDSKLIAQLAANHVVDSDKDTKTWYRKYMEVLENIGWVIQELNWSKMKSSSTDVKVSQAVVDLIGGILSAGQTGDKKKEIFGEAMKSLKSLEDSENGDLTIFSNNVNNSSGGKFQMSYAKMNPNGNIECTGAAFYTNKHSNRGNFLWVKWGHVDVEIYAANQTLELNERVYSRIRNSISNKLGKHSDEYIEKLDISLPW